MFATEDSTEFQEDSSGNDGRTTTANAEEIIRNLNDLTSH